MKELFALQGAARKGKTTTIGILYEMMRNADYTIRQPKRKEGAFDFFVVMEKDGTRIGVSTYGDSARQIINSIRFFNQHSCEVAVCACRTKGATVQVLYTFGCSVDLVRKSVSDNKNDIEQMKSKNVKDAEILFNKIEQYLKKKKS